MTKISTRPIDTLSRASLESMLEYLSEEVETAHTKEDFLAILSVAREMLSPAPLRNAVTGLKNIRAEVDCRAIRGERAPQLSTLEACTVHLDIPPILKDTFQALSRRMNTLQSEDPDTFVNATSALTWLASGTIRIS